MSHDPTFKIHSPIVISNSSFPQQSTCANSLQLGAKKPRNTATPRSQSSPSTSPNSKRTERVLSDTLDVEEISVDSEKEIFLEVLAF